MRGPAHGRGVRVRVGFLGPAAAATAAAVIGLAGCGGGRATTGTHTGRRGSDADPSTIAGSPRARRPRRVRPSKSELRLQRALDQQLKVAGGASGAFVYDITTERPLFSVRAAVKRPPASVEKLFTSVAVLDALGPKLRLHTAIYGTGYLAGGVWHGNLYLRGGGDPTFGDGAFNHNWEQGYGPTAEQLANQLIAAGIHKVSGLVIGDPSLFDDLRGPPSTGFQPDTPDLGGELAALTYDHGATGATPGMPGSASTASGTTAGAATGVSAQHARLQPLSPGAFAAHQLTVILNQMHVQATASVRTHDTPRRSRRLAIVSSPSMSILLRLMDVPSDDFFAEMLTKQLGAKIVGDGSTKAGALVIKSVIGRYHLHPEVVDGSGLSRHDLTSPAEVVDLLRDLHGSPTGKVLDASLPTVGVDGTVRTIALGTTAVDRCIAKTGTLDNVTNLAGYCQSRGHQLVAFALFVDGPENWSALEQIGKMVGAIATY